MIPTYEQMGDWLEEIAGEFPDAFFEELDGRHPAGGGGPA